ncbi:putative F-box protein At1g32420 [Apium graveolens]|uniref:putative F-box protein At1g32420 n=1 Tax=Apium graveolens TaxID=4045 RepID=UPI003D7915C5
MGGFVSRSSKHKDDPRLPLVHEDLIRGEILPRLPVKSLVRFRCVCKSWNLLLSNDPIFVQSHLTRNCMDPNKCGLITRCLPRNIHKYKVHPLRSRYLELGGSVNGLVCVYHFDDHAITYFGIWNPATNQYKDISLPPSTAATSDFCFGLGFNSVANDYKLVFVVIYHERPLLSYVYSCNHSSWVNNIVKSDFVARGVHYAPPTIVQGCPYWFNSSVKCLEHSYVVSFDIQHGVFRLLPGIDFVNSPSILKLLVNFRDSLTLLLCDSSPSTLSKSVDVYMLDERCSLWTKNYIVDPITIPGNMFLTHSFRNGDLLFAAVNKDELLLVRVNPETQTITKSETYSYDSSRWNLFFSYSLDYTESLVSIKGSG